MFFEYYFDLHPGVDPDVRAKVAPLIKGIEQRFEKLERCLQLSGLSGEQFSIGAATLFQQGILDDLQDEEVVRMATALSAKAKWEPRIDFGMSVGTICDMRFISKEEKDAIWRLLGLGGSDVAATQGISGFRGPLDVVLDKRGTERDLTNKFGNDGNAKAYIFGFGNACEDLVIDEFCRRYGFQRVPEYRMFYAMSAPELTANVDGILRDPATSKLYIFEAKTANINKRSAWLGGAPDYYLTQVHEYLGILRDTVEAAFIGCVFNNNPSDCVFWRVEKDEAAEDAQMAKLSEFWAKYVVGDEDPPMTGRPALDKAALRRKDPPRIGDQIDLPGCEDICAEYFRLNEAYLEKRKIAEQARAERDEVGNEVLERMEGATFATCGEFVATQPTSRPKATFDSAAIQKLRLKYPTAYRDCVHMTETPGRFVIRKAD